MDLNITNISKPFGTSNVFSSSFRSIEAKIFTSIVTIFIFFLGLFGNGLVIMAYFRSTKLRETTTKFTLNLAITDISTSIYVFLFRAVYFIPDFGRDCYVCCIMLKQLGIFCMFVSQMIITIATFERYISICHGIRHVAIMTEATVNTLLTLAWFVPIPFVAIPFFGFNHWDSLHACRYHILFHDWVYDLYSTIMVVLTTISFFLYIQILFKAHKFHSRMCPAHIHGINARTVTVMKKMRSIRNGKIIGMVTIFFAICWLPYQIYQFRFGLNTAEDTNVLLASSLFFLGLSNCVINPFIYGLQKQEFKEEAMKILKCMRFKRSNCNDEHLRRNFHVGRRQTNEEIPLNSKNVFLVGANRHGSFRIHSLQTNDTSGKSLPPKQKSKLEIEDLSSV